MSEMTMGQRIAEQRKKLGLSQEALGEKVGVSRQAISKWESDGAVPEIDKLISLSRLFSVSVGWLLGVEENTPPQPDELSETQIKMVEEIVRRYQSAPEPKRASHWLPRALISLLLFFVVYLLCSQNAPDYSGQISSLQSNYQAIQLQLQSLSGKVEDIASAAEESEKLLQSHQFQLLELGKGGHSLDPVSEENLQDEELPEDVTESKSIIVDLPIAELRFSAVPKQRAESDRAWLVVLLNGQPFGQTECIWAGSEYTAKFSLWLEDGYEHRFVVEHADGTQDIQVLEEFEYNDLAYGTSPQCTVESFVWKYDPQSWIFRISNFWIMAEKPLLGNYGNSRWTKAGLIFYRNGEEIERNVLPVEAENAGNAKLVKIYTNTDASPITIRLEEDDALELTFYAALDNGMTIEKTIGKWTYQDGQLLLLSEE